MFATTPKGITKIHMAGKSKTHLSVIGSAGRKERLKRVVTGDQETSEVNEKLSSNVEEDQEEVDADQAQDRIDLGDVGLALQVVEDRVLGELYGCFMVSKLYILGSRYPSIFTLLGKKQMTECEKEKNTPPCQAGK